MDNRAISLIRPGLWIALMTLPGCSYKTTSVYEQPTAPPAAVSQPGEAREAPPGEAPSQSRPVGELLAKAELEHSAGQLSQAEATLERAIRIAPKDPVLWQRLAEIRLDQGDAQQAETLARKSNSLVTLDTNLMHRNWQIIAQARRMRGDEEGAQEAEGRARHLGSQ
jgi:cytochrome c-type biogenesis protein CcmH/NrfG